MTSYRTNDPWSDAPEQACRDCGATYPATPQFFTENYARPNRVTSLCLTCSSARKLPVPEGTKRCRKCQAIKPLTEFYPLNRPQATPRHHLSRYKSRCKLCTSAEKKAELASLSTEAREARRLHQQALVQKRLGQNRPSNQFKTLSVMRPEERSIYLGPIAHGLRGIYQIRHKGSGKVYVGSAENIRARWLAHLKDLGKGSHHCHPLQRAWRKYGQDAFTFEVLELVGDSPHIVSIEQAWIDFLGAHVSKGGYNLAPVAASAKGVKRTVEQRQRLLESLAHTRVPYIVIWPDGREETTPSLREFARQYGVSLSNLKCAVLGKGPCLGFKCRPLSMPVEKWQSARDEYARSKAKPRVARYRVRLDDGREHDFSTRREVAEFLKVTPAMIGHVLAGRAKTCREATISDLRSL